MRRSAIIPVLATVLALTGCGIESDPVAVPPGSGESIPAPASATETVVGRYTKLNGTCPTLDDDTAKTLKLPTAGKPADVNADTPMSQIVTCTWGTGVGSVSVLVTIDRHPGTPTAEERTAEQFEQDWQASIDDGRTLAPQPVSGVGDKAYIGAHRDRQSLVLSLRASNAQLQFSYGVADMPPDLFAATIDRNTATLVALGQDILNDLS
jgi:predicted small lipoprotein YifL